MGRSMCDDRRCGEALLARVFSGSIVDAVLPAFAKELSGVWLDRGAVNHHRLNRLAQALAELRWFSTLSLEHQRAMVIDGYKLLSLEPTYELRVHFAEHWAAIARDDDKRSRFEQLRREGRLAA